MQPKIGNMVRQSHLNPKLFVILALGFISGLPLGLSGSLLQAWVTKAGLDIADIGMLSLVGLPYTYKFLWSPFFDRFKLPFLTRRRGWMLIIQSLLAVVIFAMSFLDPLQQMLPLAILAFIMATLSATSDILIDAYRTEILNTDERGLGSAYAVSGYRLAMVVSGGLSLKFAHYYGFTQTYQLMALLMCLGPLVVLLSSEKPPLNSAPVSFKETVKGAIRSIVTIPKIVWCLAFVVLYKIGDAFAHSLLTTFLLDTGFDLNTIGDVFKVFGFIATIMGVFLGGYLLQRLSLFKALMIFGFLQSFTNLGFYVLAQMGAHLPTLVTVVFVENLSSGMGTAALMVFIMGLCDTRFTATQFALLSAFSAFARVWVGPAAGFYVKAFGWSDFFTLSLIMSIPGLIVLYILKDIALFKAQYSAEEDALQKAVCDD